jgi:hypothetical protein
MNALAQVNFRCDRQVRDDFVKTCEANHRTQADVLVQMMEAYTAAGNESSVRHLNGDLCPLSELIRTLAGKVREMLP